MLPPDSSATDTQPHRGPAPESPAPAVRHAVTTAPSQAVPPPALNAGPGLEAITRAFTHRLKFVLLFGTLALFLGAAAGWVLTPSRFVAQGHIQLANKASREGAAEENILNFQRTQMTVVKSHGLLRKLLDVPDIADLREVQLHGDQNDQIAWLQKELLVEAVLNNPEVLRLTLPGKYPEDLASILNKLMEIYVEDNKLKEQVRLNVRIKQLEESYKEASTDLLALRKELGKKEVEFGLTAQKEIPERIAQLENQMQPFTTQQFQLQLEQARADLTVKNLRFNLEHPNLILISDQAITRELRQDPSYIKLMEDYRKLEDQMTVAVLASPPANREAARQGYLPRLEPFLKRIDFLREQARQGLLREELDKTKKSLTEAEALNIVLLGQMAELKKKIDPLQRDLEALKDRVRGPGRVVPEVEAMREKVTLSESDIVQKGRELVALKGDLGGVGRAAVLETAAAPTELKYDRKVKVAGMTGVSLLGLALFGVAFVEYRSRRVYSPDDVTRGLCIPLVGTMPSLPADARKPLPGPDGTYLPGQAQLLESMDAIRTVLLRAGRTDGVRVVMVTSAGGGEGKTSVATHLAASLARGWRNTLLIDGDLRNPAAAAQFDLPSGPGLSEVLRGETTADEVIKPTTLPRLSLLPAGRCDPYTLQALAQEEVGTLIGRLKEEYDFVVIDVSPALPVSDAMMIGQHADAVILTVLKNVSRLPAVYAAQQRLASLDIPILGAVVIGENVNAYGINPYPLRLRG